MLNTKQIRRIVAIALTVLTFICLFWPPMIMANMKPFKSGGIDIDDADAKKGYAHEELINSLVSAMSDISFRSGDDKIEDREKAAEMI